MSCFSVFIFIIKDFVSYSKNHEYSVPVCMHFIIEVRFIAHLIDDYSESMRTYQGFL